MRKIFVLCTWSATKYLYLLLLTTPVNSQTLVDNGPALVWRRDFACGEQEYQQGHLSSAEECFRSALAAARHSPDAGSMRGGALAGLGGILLEQGRLTEAERVLTEAIEVLRRCTPEGCGLYLAGALQRMGSCYMQQNRMFEAEALLDQALVLFSRGHGTKRQIADVLVSRGWLELNRRRPAAAQTDFRRALANLDTTPIGSRVHAVVYNSLSAALIELNRPREAMEAAKQAFEIAHSIPGITPPDMADHACALANAAFQTRDYALAEQTLTDARLMLERNAESETRELGVVLAGLAKLRYVEKRYMDAAQLQSSAVSILQRHLSPDHPQMAGAVRTTARMLRKVNRAAEARRLERELRQAQSASAEDPGERHRIGISDLQRR